MVFFNFCTEMRQSRKASIRRIILASLFYDAKQAEELIESKCKDELLLFRIEALVFLLKSSSSHSDS